MMSQTKTILSVLFAIVVAAGVVAADPILATVYFDQVSRTYYYKTGINDPNGVAIGSFNDTLEVSGWGVLKIETSNFFNDPMQMYAAGFLEGAITASRIYQNYQNMYDFFFSDEAPSTELLEWFKTQGAWVDNMIASNSTPYWEGVNLIQQQFKGLVDGYTNYCDETQILPLFAFQMLNGVGDLLDLIPALNIERRPHWESMSKQQVLREFGKRGHCSGFIKVPGDLSDLFSAHSSWFTYGAMNRIYKHYNFLLTSDFIAATQVSFSSYPGFLESLDDFYIMNSGLTMVQTTNSILNMSIYDEVTPHALLAWQRGRLANHIATNGAEWCYAVSEYNSGTYNNQYMVVNYNQFQVCNIPYASHSCVKTARSSCP